MEKSSVSGVSGWVQTHPHFWLQTWEYDDPLTKAFVNQVKGDNPLLFYREWVRIYLLHRSKSLLKQDFDGVVYPTRKGQWDHAAGLAQAWAEVLGVPSVPLYLVHPDWKQALQTREERKKIQFHKPTLEPILGPILEHISEPVLKPSLNSGLEPSLKPKGEARHRRLLFVDDILTTGGTALGAARVCPPVEIFAIWTLFYRPALFPKPSVDRV